MLFHSTEFLVMFAIVLFLYYLLPRYRAYTLGAANVLFYAVTGWGMLALFLAVTVFTFIGTRLIESGRRKRFWLFVTVGGNLFNLAFFKYSVFLLEALEHTAGIRLVSEDSFVQNIVLPVGISFYTFQLIAYTVDVARGYIPACRSLLHFWVFISLFAHLIAGPIMRGKEFMPQIEGMASIRFRLYNFRRGVFWFGLGLFKKIMIADYLAPIVDGIYAKGTMMSTGEAWTGTYLFAFQVLMDFSAYSEMALGLGYMLGMKLALNFKSPYISQNPSELWTRWHITLSSWIRDYVYIPLGGNRKGKIRTYFNLWLAMTLSGLWHGASWTFVLWGAYHGLLLIGYRLVKKPLQAVADKLSIPKAARVVVAVFAMFHLVCIGWVLFRADNLETAVLLIYKMAHVWHLRLTDSVLNHLLIFAALYLFHVLEYFAMKKGSKLYGIWFRKIPFPVRSVAYAAAALFLIVFTRGVENTFIYFQF
ncbi:MBOAT family O-acyltransferase [Paenibacillus thermoaerophilus]|uniref:MBOAT family O-acyltransferase n=1 Tax=Paenibacillus thermoaerophilus TaxID=1215385 RepID=A0ABW2V9S2_9BACL|nr:MBOAT family O-acyltransferase [Paenibacillus thermoaerophilus]TMV08413.1 MBOAT family protein [Paenibacillus thermoaerophilus]